MRFAAYLTVDDQEDLKAIGSRRRQRKVATAYRDIGASCRNLSDLDQKTLTHSDRAFQKREPTCLP